MAAPGGRRRFRTRDVIGDPIAPPGDTIRTPVPRDPPRSTVSVRRARAGVRHRQQGRGPRRPLAAAAGSGRRGSIGGAILALAVLVAGVGIYLLLPSAAISVTPRQEPVGPIDITVTADTTASAPTPPRLVVPAQQVPVPVSVSDTFNATGKRVALTNATGNVRFQNLDPTSTNRIAAGSIVRDQLRCPLPDRGDGHRPARRADHHRDADHAHARPGEVKVTAVEADRTATSTPGRSSIVPSGENSLFLKVSNPEPTTGGTSQEFTRVTQADVDGALAALNASLAEAFTEAMADPALVSQRADRLPGDREPRARRPRPCDPATLVGQEVATFDLGLSATGTVVAGRLRAGQRDRGDADPGRRSSPTTSSLPDPST